MVDPEVSVGWKRIAVRAVLLAQGLNVLAWVANAWLPEAQESWKYISLGLFFAIGFVIGRWIGTVGDRRIRCNPRGARVLGAVAWVPIDLGRRAVVGFRADVAGWRDSDGRACARHDPPVAALMTSEAAQYGVWFF